MNRFHVNLAVTNVAESAEFYTKLFGAEPVVRKDDYAKWLLDDPQLNFSIAHSSQASGIQHLGLQVDSRSSLGELRQRVVASGGERFDEGETTCCYAQSDKSWVADPQGVEWEAFYTHGESETFSGSTEEAKTETPCCEPNS